MYCRFCGKEIEDGARFCPYCGKAQQDVQAPPPPQQKAVDPNDAPSAGFAVLGFFFPIVGLILYLVWMDTMPQRARSCGKGALISVIVGVAGGVIAAIIAVIVLFVVGAGVHGALLSALCLPFV